MMQIFVRKPQGTTTTLNVESCERICTIKRKLKEKEGIHSGLHLGLIYSGRLLEDGHTLDHYNILEESTLHLLLSQHTFVEPWNLHVETWSQKSFTLKVKSVDTIDDVKAKIQENEGIPPSKQLLFFLKKWLEDGSRSLADYDVRNHCTLHLAIQFQQGPQSALSQLTQPNVTSEQAPLHNLSTPPAQQEAPRRNKRARPATQTTPSTHSIFDTGDGESASCKSQGAALKSENKETKEDHTVARSKEKELEATISGLTQKITLFSAQCVSYERQIFALKAENKKTEEVLTVARNKEKKLEATIAGLTHKNKTFSAQCSSYENQIVALEAEHKETKEELTVACRKEKELEAMCDSYESQLSSLKAEYRKTKEERMFACSKEKELEVTISRLRHMNKVFSAHCATYESQVVALEVENKKTKEELMNADKKYYAGARSAGYAEGLKEGKAKWFKSVEFLHHLTDASMQYFDYGFDSCQKQAEEQGFMGQLNKDSALEEAPQLKGCDQPQ
ncbi:hypothetical protein ACS0TY_015045 [Phlomoides rotata]